MGLAWLLVPHVVWDLHGGQALYANLAPAVSWPCGEAGVPEVA